MFRKKNKNDNLRHSKEENMSLNLRRGREKEGSKCIYVQSINTIFLKKKRNKKNSY